MGTILLEKIAQSCQNPFSNHGLVSTGQTIHSEANAMRLLRLMVNFCRIIPLWSQTLNVPSITI
jgi:hypothetical protein